MRDFLSQKSSILVIIGIAFVVQMVTAYTAIGYFHPDQHFQIVEPSSRLTSQNESYQEVWEFESMIRPTLAIYSYYCLREFSDVLGISNPFSEQFLGRLVISILSFYFSFLLLFRSLKDSSLNSKYLGTILLGFAWVFPYTRSMLSSENISLIFLAWSLYLLIGKDKRPRMYLFCGAIIGLAFYFRFQIAFAYLGVIIALLFEEKWLKKLSLLAVGFAIVAVLNTLLDSSFYGQFVLTPWQYFQVNIMEGVAASFGVKGPFYYPAVILLILAAPLISLVFFAFAGIFCWKEPKNYLVLSVIFFLLGHSLVGHKEERFLVPIFSLLPILVAQGYDLVNAWGKNKKWLRTIYWLILVPSALINTFLLFIFLFMPYHQNLAMVQIMAKEFKNEDHTEIYCLRQGPFQTPSQLTTRYYENGFPENVKLIVIEDINGLPEDRPILLATKYKYIRNQDYFQDKTKVHPIFYSNKSLLHLTVWLEARTRIKIDDAWVLYQIEQ